MMYEVSFTSAAERYFKKLKEKPLTAAYKQAISKLSEDPYIGQQKKGNLTGIYGYDVKYKGINHEIAYTIHEENGNFIIVLLAGTRENFYEELVRSLK